MNIRQGVMALLLAALSGTALADSADEAAFNRLKSLAGTWEGREEGKPDVFDFAGGTGFDPAKDPHVHSGYLRLLAPDQLEGRWTFFRDGKEQSFMRLLMQKK
ncbi:MAG TPA: hypothetical protein VIL32_04735 [Steroidobacteraceae bacterium]